MYYYLFQESRALISVFIESAEMCDISCFTSGTKIISLLIVSWITALNAPAHIMPRERTPFPSNSSFKLQKSLLQPLLYCVPQKTLIILEFSENQNQLSTDPLVISSPKTSNFILLSSPSLWIRQSQSTCWFFDFLEISRSRTHLPPPLHTLAQARIRVAIT